MKTRLLIFLLLPGCALPALLAPFHPCNRYTLGQRYEHSGWGVRYRVRPDTETPAGTPVDTSGYPVDLPRVDALVSELEPCLHTHISRCSFTVKVAPDWRQQTCANDHGGQLFPCTNPGFAPGCEDAACPCGCSGVIQYPATVIVTPNLAALKHELVHLVTGARHGDHRFDCQ